jgi:CheY-like chemotaxis protein
MKKKNSNSIKQQAKIYFLWNDDKFSLALKEEVGNERIITTDEELIKLLNKDRQIDVFIILTELTWNNKKFSEFYGFEKAFQLIKKGIEIPLIFCSFLDRGSLKKHGNYSPILARIFSFQQLPFNENIFTEEFILPSYSKTKWFFIQRLVREQSAVYDDIKHRFLIDETNLNEITKALEYSLEYENILDIDTISFLDAIKQTIENGDDKSISDQISAFGNHLDKMIYNSASTELDELDASVKESIMLVEDNLDILEKLKSYLSKYFEVTCFSEGKKALEELENNNTDYDAIVADLELLDKGNNWQEVTGYDILEVAVRYQHIALYGLTAMPKRAVSELQENLDTRRIKIKYKDRKEYLPLGYSAGAFAEIIKDEIRELSKRRKGPKLGLWKKGLRYTYYEVKSNKELWDEILNEIYDRVDNLLTFKNNNDDIIPKKLISEKVTSYDDDVLKKIIMHRLLCIYHQAHDENFNSEVYKTLVGINYSNFKNYLTTILGFSITAQHDDVISNETTIFNLTITESELLDEENNWINQRRVSDPELIPAANYPILISLLADIKDFLANPELNKIKLKKVSDFIKFFNVLSEIVIEKKSLLKIMIWIRDYKENQKELQSLLNLPKLQGLKDIIDSFN